VCGGWAGLAGRTDDLGAVGGLRNRSRGQARKRRGGGRGRRDSGGAVGGGDGIDGRRRSCSLGARDDGGAGLRVETVGTAVAIAVVQAERSARAGPRVGAAGLTDGWVVAQAVSGGGGFAAGNVASSESISAGIAGGSGGWRSEALVLTSLEEAETTSLVEVHVLVIELESDGKRREGRDREGLEEHLGAASL